MTESSPPTWGADPSIAWRILLTATPTTHLTVAELSDRQVTLHRAQGWPAPPPVTGGDPTTLRRDLAEVRDAPLVVGLAGDQVLISVFHAYADGLGLLDVLAALTGEPVATSARGVGDRPAEDGGAVDRLREVAFAPPAGVALPPVTPAEGDAFATVAVGGRVGTSELVHAGVAAIVAHNADRRRASKHVTVAVGAGRPTAPGEPIQNRSELIRLRDLERVSRSAIRDALRIAPLDQAGGSGAAGGRLGALALRALAPRLGSTLLVSHLGEVTTTAASDLAFYPVTAGGTGLSLGAVGHAGRTVFTLRARGASWDEAALATLLDRIAEATRTTE